MSLSTLFMLAGMIQCYLMQLLSLGEGEYCPKGLRVPWPFFLYSSPVTTRGIQSIMVFSVRGSLYFMSLAFLFCFSNTKARHRHWPEPELLLLEHLCLLFYSLMVWNNELEIRGRNIITTASKCIDSGEKDGIQLDLSDQFRVSSSVTLF